MPDHPPHVERPADQSVRPGAVGDRWGSTARGITRRLPCRTLQPFVKSLVVLDRTGQDVDQVHVLPDEQATMLFSVAPGTRLIAGGRVADGEAGLMMLGPPTRAYSRLFEGVPLTIVVTFKPAGAHLVSGVSMCELADASVGLREFIGDAANRLTQTLSAAQSNHERLDRLERFLLDRLERCSGRAMRATRVVDEALDRLQRRCHDESEVQAETVAAECSTSARQLRRLFKTVVGLNPHALVRIERFHRALSLARSPGAPPWAEIANCCGYFDQSHMIAEFNAFAGASPRTMLGLLDSGLPHLLQGDWFSETPEVTALSP